MIDLATLAIGLAILVGGAELLVRSASSLARGVGVPPLAIGITVVAFGTSVPELAVNLAGAITGSTELCFGNVVGSNLANVGLIVGVGAVMRPLAIQRVVVARDLPIMIGTTLFALALCVDGLVPWELDRSFGRIDGSLLLLGFCAFVVYTARRIRTSREETRAAPDAAPLLASRARDGLLLAVGVVGLALGADLTVIAARAIAEAAGVPEAIIGLSLVALGTSLPELSTTVVATLRGQVDLAVGNVVGSNILNLLLVLGATAMLAPVSVPRGGIVDLVVALGFSIALLGVSSTNSRQVLRWEGGLLFGCYLTYLAIRVLW